MARHTYFSTSWLNCEKYPEFAGWLQEVTSDNKSASCKVCSKIIKLSNMGINAIRSHLETSSHKKNSRAKCSQLSMASFTRTNTESAQISVRTDPPMDTTSETRSTSSITNFVYNEANVSTAEITWCFQVIESNMSLNSCDAASANFRKMFPDSQIAQQFTLGKTKAAYVINHGISPYLRDCLETELRSCPNLVICFDESLNKVVQRCQMDIVVRYWDNSQQRVATRYLNSIFLGRSTAEDLLEGFRKGILQIPIEKILQISMDGPNVNFKFMRRFNECSEEEHPEGQKLLDLGVCGLHTVNGGVKTAFLKVNWDIGSFLRALYNLFKDSPARRAKFTELTGSTVFPKKFTTVRWLENGECVDRAVNIYAKVAKFVKEEKIDNKSFELIKNAMADPLLKAKLLVFKSVLGHVEPFLTRFQSDKPLIPFLHTSLEELVRHLLSRFVKQEKLADIKSSMDLMNFDLHNLENYRSIQHLNIGYGAKSYLKEKTFKEKDVLIFKKDFQQILIGLIEKLKEKSPLRSHLAKGLTSLDPKILFHRPTVGMSRMDIVLQHLHDAKRISEHEAEKAKREYVHLTQEVHSNTQLEQKVIKTLEECNDSVGMDEFYLDLVGGSPEYKNIWAVIKMCLILSHGNASVEGGFSINKHLLVENLLEDSLVAQRIIKDYLKKVGGTGNVDVNPKLIASVRGSRRKYEQYLEKKRNEQRKQTQERMDKRKLDHEIKELEEQRKKLAYQREKEDVELEAKKKLLEKLKSQV